LYVVRRGRVIARTPAVCSELSLGDVKQTIDWLK